MAGQTATRRSNARRRRLVTINSLADELGNFVGDLGRSRELTQRVNEFAELAGVATCSPTGEDLALSLAAAAVVQQYWRLSDAQRIDDALEFSARDPVCNCVLRSLERGDADEVVPSARDVAVELTQSPQISTNAPLVGFLELLTAAYSKQRRKELGVYYTPAEVVRFLVDRTNAALRDEFGANAGDGSHEQTLFDPALGSGAFPLEIIGAAYRNWRGNSDETNEYKRSWSDYVSNSLLPKLVGYEVMPAAFVVANLLVVMELMQTGFDPSPNDRLHFHLGDALEESTRWVNGDVIPVIIGNPPYHSLSTNEHAWVSQLMRGKAPDETSCASYFHVDGAPLGERKTWLHDDYVKFFRVAQWQVERCGAGVLAFVTNHGFLDNPSFRGMRAALAETFDVIEVIDLHGNTKKSLNGRDESVFETSQGMALTVAWRTGDSRRRAEVRRGNLRGTRREKLTALAEATPYPVALTNVTIHPPHYLFDTTGVADNPEYVSGYGICDIMPVNTTAPVTARDWFVIDHDRNRLVERLTQFADLSIADDEIRRRYFHRGRSSRYPPGDTRGWKLHDARRRLASETDWQRHIRECWYRPFDRRWIFWTDWMIDWPRESVLRHFQRENLALVCRRQSPRGRACNYFGIVDDITLDGFVRSDNRGSESVFPLYLEDEPHSQVNVTKTFIEDCEAAWSAKFDDTAGASALLSERLFSATDLLHYVFALFNSPTYRLRYESELAIDFPRILLVQNFSLFRQLAAIGRKLAENHLPRIDSQDEPAEVTYQGEAEPVVDAGFPKHKQERVYLNANAWFESISSAAWEYKVGAHQVLRKWLKDRRGDVLDNSQLAHYGACVRAVETSMTLQSQIDATIEQFGGWPGAFALRRSDSESRSPGV